MERTLVFHASVDCPTREVLIVIKLPNDRYGFLTGHSLETSWKDHLPLLFLALHETKNSPRPVLELGFNNDSSPLIREHCRHEGRRAVLIDDDINRCNAALKMDCVQYDVQCCAYDEANFDRNRLWSVAVISNAPGERRVRDARRIADKCEIVILRDTQPAADYGYKYSEMWSQFKSRVDIKTNGAWASAVSNSRDLSTWRGTRLGPYIVSGGDEDQRTDVTAEKIKRFQRGDVDVESGEF